MKKKSARILPFRPKPTPPKPRTPKVRIRRGPGVSYEIRVSLEDLLGPADRAGTDPLKK